MKKYFYILLGNLFITYSFAADDNYTGIANSRLREGNVHLQDIP